MWLADKLTESDLVCLEFLGVIHFPNPPELSVFEPKWTKAQLAGASRCKRCREPIQWGEVVKDVCGNSYHEITREPKKVPYFVPLDPNLMPHHCKR